MIFWSLGCNPELDSTWINLDCKAMIDFEVDKTDYTILRYKDLVSLRKGNDPVIQYPKITGEFAIKLAEIFGFKALLLNRDGKPETPPPAYYFLPFYIDQKKSWSKAWNNFQNLEQYANWQSTIIKYHIGLLGPEHFEIETTKYLKKEEQLVATQEVAKVDTALEVVFKNIPDLNTSIDENEFEKLTSDIRTELSSLASKQESVLTKLSQLETDRVYLEHQKGISERIITELDKDYVFAVERIDHDFLECPLCGEVHQNSLVNRASILTDKKQAENQLETINNSLKQTISKLAKCADELVEIRNGISVMNDKYVIEEKDSKINLNCIIENVAGNSIRKTVMQTKTDNLAIEKRLENEIKQLKKDQKDLISEELQKDIFDDFILTLVGYVKILQAESVNIATIDSPLKYSQMIKEGGAADGARAVLGYYLTIYSLVEKYGSEVKAPLVIDTPNQQEQSFTNYSSIVDLITNKLPKDSQIILCAMENSQLDPFKQKANVIQLDKDRLLSKSKYAEVKKVFDAFN
jgi:hypothetical protein